MDPGNSGDGKFGLPEGHPARGPARAGESLAGEREDFSGLFREDAGQGPMSFSLPGKEKPLAFRLDGRLTGAFRSIGSDPPELIREALARSPDGERLLSALQGKTFGGGLLDASFNVFEDHRRSGYFGVNRAVFDVRDPVIRRILLQVGIVHILRHEAMPEGGLEGSELEKSLIKKDAGLFLLLLTDHKRKVFFLPRILREVDSIVARRSGFRDVLVPILSKLPFVQADDPADSEVGIPFINGNAFDRLSALRKLRLILGGLLAWYTVLSLGLLLPFRRIFRAVTPYYDPALQMLKHSFKEGFLVKKGFIGHAARSFFRGNLPEAVEFFWSGWNPVLVRVAVRPVFRFFGGNRFPVLATALTFFYTAWIVHLLWAAGLVLLIMRIASAVDPAFEAGARIGSNLHFIVLFSAVAAYTLFGLLSGISKARRARRQRGRAAG